MKKALSLCCMLVLVFQLLACPIQAAAPEEMKPYYTGVYSIAANLRVVNDFLGKSESQAVVIMRSGYSAEVSMTLNQISSSGVDELKSWSDSLDSTGEVKHTYYIPSGYTYTLVVSIDVYDSNGDFVETIATSDSMVY